MPIWNQIKYHVHLIQKLMIWKTRNRIGSCDYKDMETLSSKYSYLT